MLWTSVVVIRAPLAPSGCPMAIEPPRTLTFSGSSFSIRMQAMACEAKASFSSIRSMSASFMPARLSAFFVAGTGPVPITAGSTPTTAVATTRTSGFRPSDLAFSSDMTSSAAAPSFNGELLPAVTVPMPGMKAGFSARQRFHAGVGAHALIEVDQDAVALFVATPDRQHLALEFAFGLCGGGQLMTAQGELVLLFARDALRLRQELGGDAHRQGALGSAMKQLGIQVNAGVHRNVLHVFQAADDLHVFEAGHDGVRRLVDRLQA